jgi:hypothetical protein
MLEEIFNGTDRVEKILALTERMERIGRAVDRVKYDNDLVLEIPEVVKTLKAAKDAIIAELKTL